VAALCALTVLGNTPATTSTSGESIDEGGARAATARFAARCVSSAASSACLPAFSLNELGCLVYEALPRLCDPGGLLSDCVHDFNRPLGPNNGGSLDLREAMLQLSRVLAHAEEEGEEGGGGEGGGSLAAALGEYVSPGFLEPCRRLRE
jgi:hypothetical protein